MEEELKRNQGVLPPESLSEYREALKAYKEIAEVPQGSMKKAVYVKRPSVILRPYQRMWPMGQDVIQMMKQRAGRRPVWW